MKKRLSLGLLTILSLPALSAEWDYPLAKNDIDSHAVALAYLEQTYPDVGELRFRYQTHSLLGAHYHFDVWQNGQYQHQKTLVLSTDKAGRVTRVFKSLQNTLERDGVAIVAAELESPRQLIAHEPPQLSEGVQQSVGVQIFDPDLRTMDALPAPASAWNTLSDYPNPPHYRTTEVELLHSAGRYYLANERVRQVDAIEMQQQALPGQWVNTGISLLPAEGVSQWHSMAEVMATTWDDHRFVQLMAFYHLDQSLQYIEQLGFSLFNQPLKFDARGLATNNSSYYLGPMVTLLGIGGSPDALDADVVIHELGHGIHYQIAKDWAYGHSGALGEGFGDYWAGSHSYRRQYAQGQAFEIDTVFNWDGYFGSRISTRSLWNKKAKYLANAEYLAHESVAGELGDELWSTPLFQTLKSAVALYGQDAFTEFDRIVLESMYGLGRGVKMHDLSESMLYTAKALYPHRRYDDLLLQHFTQHGLVQRPFRVALTPRYITPSKSLRLQIETASRPAKLEATARVGDHSTLLARDNFTQAQWDIPLPQTYTCGAKETLSLDLNYQYASYLETQLSQESLSFIWGKPVLITPAVVSDSPLKDASQDSAGNTRAGFKSYSLTLDSGHDLIGDDFSVRLHLSHPNLSELDVTLISPAGTRVSLLKQLISSATAFDDYWVMEHDDLLADLTGEPLSGHWRLEVVDHQPGNSGTLIAWGVSRRSHYLCPQTTQAPQTPVPTEGGVISLWLLLPAILLAWRRYKC